LAADYESRVEYLDEEIEEARKRRDEAAAAERSRPHLPTTQSALGTVAALAAKLGNATDEEKARLRTGIVQQLRTAFAEIVFRPVGLIELPEKPKRVRGAFGSLPSPIEVRAGEKGERYFMRHVFFRDDPDELSGLDGGKGIIRPRFV